MLGCMASLLQPSTPPSTANLSKLCVCFQLPVACEGILPSHSLVLTETYSALQLCLFSSSVPPTGSFPLCPTHLLTRMFLARVMRSRYREAMQQERAQRDDAVRQAAVLSAELQRLQLHHQHMVMEGEPNKLLHRAH